MEPEKNTICLGDKSLALYFFEKAYSQNLSWLVELADAKQFIISFSCCASARFRLAVLVKRANILLISFWAKNARPRLKIAARKKFLTRRITGEKIIMDKIKTVDK